MKRHLRNPILAAGMIAFAVGLLGHAQDTAPKKDSPPNEKAQDKTDPNKDGKTDEKKGDDKTDDNAKKGKKFGKKLDKPAEEAPPPIPVVEPELSPNALKELEKFQGEWRCVSMTRDGIPLAAADVNRIRLKNEGRKSTMIFFKEETIRSLIPNPTANPTQLDLLMLSDPDRGKTRHAIYAFEGGQLKICTSRLEVARPTGFESKRDSKLVLEVWEKVK